MKSRCGKVMASAERRVYFCAGADGLSAVITGRMTARMDGTCILYSRQRSMCTKKELIHRCDPRMLFGASFAALVAHTCSAARSRASRHLVASPGSCCASTNLIWLGAKRMMSSLKRYTNPRQSLSTRPHGPLEVSLDWILLTCVFPALFTSNPHASKYRCSICGLKHTVPRSTDRLRPVRAVMRVMRPM